jgi:hypothetical protein
MRLREHSVRRAGHAAALAAGGAVAVAGHHPGDFVRIVVSRPDTLGAHLGSAATWLRYLAESEPLAAAAAGLAGVGLVGLAGAELEDRYRAAAHARAVTDGGGAANGEIEEDSDQ